MATGKLLLGLDIGSSGIKICQLKKTGNSYTVLTVDSAEFSSDAIVEGTIIKEDVVKDTIRDLIRRNKIKQKQCVIAIPGTNVLVKQIRMPPVSEEELEKNIRWEVEHHVPYDINSVTYDTVILNHNKEQKKMDVLLVAAKKEAVNQYISVVKSAGLEVKIVDTVSFALHNMADAVYQSEMKNQIVAVINIGAATTTIMISSYGVPSYPRDIAMGGNQITEEIQKKFNLLREDAEKFKTGKQGRAEEIVPKELEDVTRVVSENIAGEIRRSITYFYETTGYDHIDKIFLCGGAVKNATTKQVLESSLGAPVEFVNPFYDLKFDAKYYTKQSLEEHGLESAVAFGLALRSTNE